MRGARGRRPETLCPGRVLRRSRPPIFRVRTSPETSTPKRPNHAPYSSFVIFHAIARKARIRYTHSMWFTQCARSINFELVFQYNALYARTGTYVRTTLNAQRHHSRRRKRSRAPRPGRSRQRFYCSTHKRAARVYIWRRVCACAILVYVYAGQTTDVVNVVARNTITCVSAQTAFTVFVVAANVWGPRGRAENMFAPSNGNDNNSGRTCTKHDDECLSFRVRPTVCVCSRVHTHRTTRVRG